MFLFPHRLASRSINGQRRIGKTRTSRRLRPSLEVLEDTCLLSPVFFHLSAVQNDGAAEITSGSEPKFITHRRDAMLVATPDGHALQAHPMLRLKGYISYHSFEVQDGVTVPPAILQQIEQIAGEYYRQTGTQLIVTDGARDAAAQAQAMLNSLNKGGEKYVLGLYRNKALVRQVIQAYRSNSTAQSRLSAMTGVIQIQIDHGQFVSKHLINNAVDVSSIGVNRKLLDTIVRSVSGEPLGRADRTGGAALSHPILIASTVRESTIAIEPGFFTRIVDAGTEPQHAATYTGTAADIDTTTDATTHDTATDADLTNHDRGASPVLGAADHDGGGQPEQASATPARQLGRGPVPPQPGG